LMCQISSCDSIFSFSFPIFLFISFYNLASNNLPTSESFLFSTDWPFIE
jgi:hypothetical protein